MELDDTLKIIIGYCDNDSCVILARVSHRLRTLVHLVRKVIIATDNVYEAVRSGLLLSFKRTCADDDEYIAIDMRDISTDMLSYTQECDKYEPYRDYISYKLCKRDVFVSIKLDYLQRALVIHAITRDKQSLLAHMRGLCGDKYQQYCAFGYAKIGDYERFINCTLQYHDILIEYAIVGGNDRIIQYVLSYYKGKEIGIYELLMKKFIKRDDYTKFDIKHIEPIRAVKYVIRYNAINIARRCGIGMFVCRYMYHLITSNLAVDMTLEMAKLLLEATNSDGSVVRFIISSRNYRLTEMLRERGLYDKQLTMRSSHTEFV